MIGLKMGLMIGDGGAGLFSPANLAGLVWWTHADTLVASPVSSWSYGPANATQGTGAAQPTWTSSSANVGGKPSVLFNGSQNLAAANTSALQLTGDLTICSVVYATAASFETIISKGATSEFDCYLQGGTTPTIVRQGSAVSSSGTASLSTKHIITITATGTNIAFYIDGTAQGTGTLAAPSSTTNSVQVGQRPGDSGTTLTGEQPETIMCSQALAAGTLTQLHRYLGARYGITVP